MAKLGKQSRDDSIKQFSMGVVYCAVYAIIPTLLLYFLPFCIPTSHYIFNVFSTYYICNTVSLLLYSLNLQRKAKQQCCKHIASFLSYLYFHSPHVQTEHCLLIYNS